MNITTYKHYSMSVLCFTCFFFYIICLADYMDLYPIIICVSVSELKN